MPTHLPIELRQGSGGRRVACGRVAMLATCVAALVITNTRHPEAQTVPVPIPAAVQRVLVGSFGFTPSDLAAISRGVAVARSLEMHDDREVSAVGAVRVAVPPSFYVERMMDIVRFKRHEAVLQIGVFSETPAPSDLAALTLDRDELQRLRECTPGRCGINLAPEALARVREGVDWDTPAGQQRATRQFRAVLVDLVRDYRTRGDAALMTYNNGTRELSTATEFRALVSSAPSLLGNFPLLHRHVIEFPRVATEGAQDVIYWSKEKVGPRIVISVTHIAMVPLPGSASPAVYAGASRQLYGTQLYESSLGLTVLLHDSTNPSQVYLIYANRSRVDAIGGFFGVIKRGIVRSRARAAVPSTLERAKLNAERSYADRLKATGGQ